VTYYDGVVFEYSVAKLMSLPSNGILSDPAAVDEYIRSGDSVFRFPDPRYDYYFLTRRSDYVDIACRDPASNASITVLSVPLSEIAKWFRSSPITTLNGILYTME